eukprot:1059370-Prorocentrum_minimum.AAC.1
MLSSLMRLVLAPGICSLLGWRPQRRPQRVTGPREQDRSQQDPRQQDPRQDPRQGRRQAWTRRPWRTLSRLTSSPACATMRRQRRSRSHAPPVRTN